MFGIARLKQQSPAAFAQELTDTSTIAHAMDGSAGAGQRE
jgi:hypothetical protein